LYKFSKIEAKKVYLPNRSPSPFRILRNDALPLAVILKISEYPGRKKAKSKVFFSVAASFFAPLFSKKSGNAK
jgi:hypothetical protein